MVELVGRVKRLASTKTEEGATLQIVVEVDNPHSDNVALLAMMQRAADDLVVSIKYRPQVGIVPTPDEERPRHS